MTNDEDALLSIAPGDIIGNFECIRVISRGGQASGVFLICPLPLTPMRRRLMNWELALWGPSQRLVKKYQLGVLKIPKAKYRDHLMNERGFLSRPNMAHPNLAQLYNRRFENTISREDRSGVMYVDVLDNAGKSHRFECLMLAYEPGGSLEDMMRSRKNQPLSPEQGVEIALQLADVLGFLHTEHKLIFNDMAPANILLHEPLSSWRGSKPQIVLIDLAVADSMENPRLEHIYGRARYMPPERLNRKKPAKMSPQVDIYGLAMVIYELLAGKFLNTGEIGEDERHIRPLRELNPRVSQELNDVIMTALHNEANIRKAMYPEMANLKQALSNVPEARKPGSIRAPRAGRFYTQIATVLLSIMLIFVLVNTALSAGASPLATPTAPVRATAISSPSKEAGPTATATLRPTVAPTRRPLATSTRIPTQSPLPSPTPKP